MNATTARDDLRRRLHIPAANVDALNALLSEKGMRVVDDLLDVVAKYGAPAEINAMAVAARSPSALREKVAKVRPEYLADLDWLVEQRDAGAFVTMQDYRRNVAGAAAGTLPFREDLAVTLEISAAQYFPWLVPAMQRSMSMGCLVPGRFIRVRKMKEQENDGDLPAFIAAMDIVGASVVETLDTKGTDGSNIHLGGPETITGYFGGVGQPNDHALAWVDEYLYYYTTYGVHQVLNVNPGTVLLGFLLHRLGVDIEFKISVFMGHDNAYAALWTLLAAKLFARDDGSSPLIGFNWSNSVNNETIEIASQVRQKFGFEQNIRFEHHITETWLHIVQQPYLRRDELLDLAEHVANISAKHEGGDPDTEATREHPSDVLDYFRDKQDIIDSGQWDALYRNFLDKWDATNATARALTKRGYAVVAASNLHT
ncbi:MAG: hypothetical protein ACK2UO_20995 [Caldilineaceae bacterium]